MKSYSLEILIIFMQMRQSVINYFVWLLPLKIVLITSIYLLYLLKTRVLKKTSRKKGILKILLEPESKFLFIIGSYILQCSVPALYIVFEPFTSKYIETLTLALKWPSYSVCLTDPAIVLILYSNVRFFSKKGPSPSQLDNVSVCK